MKIFVSYSFVDSELHIVALLLEELRKQGFTVETSDHFGGALLGNYRIMNVDFFVGIITNNSESINAVIGEWNVAQSNNVKNVLVIEDGIRVDNTQILNFVRFNRNNPRIAIDQLFRQTKSNSNNSQDSTIGDALAFGVIVAGVAALISLLSGKK